MRLQRVGHDWVTELNWEIYSATVLLSVHQRNRTNRIYPSTYISIYRYRYTEGDSLGRTRLHDCGGRVLQSDICKLEPHETWKTENQGANGTNLCPKPQEVGILISESKRKISQLQAEIKFAHSPPFFFFFFYSNPHWIGWCLFALVGDDLQSTDSNANLFQKQLHRHTQKWYFTCYLNTF